MGWTQHEVHEHCGSGPLRPPAKSRGLGCLSDCILTKTKRAGKRKAIGGHFAVVASRYNARYVDEMLRAAESALKSARADSIKVVRIHSAVEIPGVPALQA